MLIAALSTATAVLIGIAIGLFVVAVVIGLSSGVRRTRRAPGPDIPGGMRPGPSDGDLEERLRVKLYAWGAALVVLLAIWVPVYFLQEPYQNRDDTARLKNDSVRRGMLTTLPGSEENPLGFNCQRCHGPNVAGGHNVFNGNVVSVPNLQTVCGGEEFGHPQIHSLADVVLTISAGRPGTDMPSWSVRYSGAMDDQQINDVVNYILSIQKVPAAKNICINPPSS